MTGARRKSTARSPKRTKCASIIPNRCTSWIPTNSRRSFNIALIDTDLEQLQKRIEEAYDVTYSGALRYKDENYDLESSKENITALRNKIARLGPVSVNSIEDCLETQGRYDEIASQMEDLKTAESDLNQILQELTHEMVVRFNEGFEIINRNFGSVFKELFAGGHARLTIEQGRKQIFAGLRYRNRSATAREKNCRIFRFCPAAKEI